MTLGKASNHRQMSPSIDFSHCQLRKSRLLTLNCDATTFICFFNCREKQIAQTHPNLLETARNNVFKNTA